MASARRAVVPCTGGPGLDPAPWRDKPLREGTRVLRLAVQAPVNHTIAQGRLPPDVLERPAAARRQAGLLGAPGVALWPVPHLRRVVTGLTPRHALASALPQGQGDGPPQQGALPSGPCVAVMRGRAALATAGADSRRGGGGNPQGIVLSVEALLGDALSRQFQRAGDLIHCHRALLSAK
jgi:hypothetical protein